MIENSCKWVFEKLMVVVSDQGEMFLTSYHHHQFLKTHCFDCLLVQWLSSGVHICTKRRLLLYSMANQPGRGGAAARCAAALPNAGWGSLAPPGARDTSATDPNPSGLVHMTPRSISLDMGPQLPHRQHHRSNHSHLSESKPFPQNPLPLESILDMALPSAAEPTHYPPAIG